MNNLGGTQDTKYLGHCDDPEQPNCSIKIQKGLEPKEEYRVLLHELIHSLGWLQFSEEYVDQASKDITEVMWKLGYRKLSKEERKTLGKE